MCSETGTLFRFIFKFSGEKMFLKFWKAAQVKKCTEDRLRIRNFYFESGKDHYHAQYYVELGVSNLKITMFDIERIEQSPRKAKQLKIGVSGKLLDEIKKDTEEGGFILRIRDFGFLNLFDFSLAGNDILRDLTIWKNEDTLTDGDFTSWYEELQRVDFEELLHSC